MAILNINNREFDLSSPTGSEYRKQYIESFGDEFEVENSLSVSVNSHSVDGYFIELNSSITNSFGVEIFDDKGIQMFQFVFRIH
jgi:hypothetical protein